jgi:hypothetical protein
MVSRWQAMHSTTAARSAYWRGVKQRTLWEAQFWQFNMAILLAREIRRLASSGCFNVLTLAPLAIFPSKHMTCQAGPMLRYFCYRIMTKARTVQFGHEDGDD